jgi:serine/threonine protein kinase
MAPEVLNKEVYGSKADIWSCGIVLYEMLFGYCPYGHCNIAEMLDCYSLEKTALPVPFP